jgi:hypothetical protein
MQNPEQNIQSTHAWPAIWNWVDVALITLSTVVLILLGIWALTTYIDLPLGNTGNPPLIYTISLTALEAFGLVVSIYIFGVLRKKLTWADIGFIPASNRWIAWALLSAVVVIPILSIVALAIQLLLGLPTGNPQLNFLVPDQFNWLGALGMIFFGGIAVPIAEEIYFRGLLYHWMRQRLNIALAIPLSALVFGLLHGDIAVAGATFVIGLILAWFYERTRSLWASIAIHIFNNTFSLVLLYTLLASGVDLSTMV